MLKHPPPVHQAPILPPAVDLLEVTLALSDALDALANHRPGHARQVASIAARLWQGVGWEGEQLANLVLAALLHDFGRLLILLDKPTLEGLSATLDDHARLGYLLLTTVEPFTPMAEVVLHHHTPWPQLRQLPRPLARQANTLFLACQVVNERVQHPSFTLASQARELRRLILHRGAGLFAPKLLQSFGQLAAERPFWVIPASPTRELRPLVPRGRPLTLDHLRQLAALFGRVVDAKSAYFANHSGGVARLSRHLGALAGLSPLRCQLLEVAGHLHDLGKLHIPNAILDKPGPLDARERALVDRRVHHSQRALAHIGGLEEVAEWTLHPTPSPPETPYPFPLTGLQPHLEASILAVADTFQALSQERPHRPALTTHEMMDNLNHLVTLGFLDPHVVQLVNRNFDTCRQIAITCPLEPDLQG